MLFATTLRHALAVRVVLSPLAAAALDPLVCSRCGQRMSIVAFVTNAYAIHAFLDHLGLSTSEAEKPPPIREVLRVAKHGEGWDVPAQSD